MMNDMRALLITLFAAVSLSASAETVTLFGTFEGEEVATVKISIEVAADHSVVKSYTSKMTFPGNIIDSESTIHFSADGLSVDETEKESLNGVVKRDLLLAFSPTGVTVTDKLNGEKKTYLAPASPTTKDPSDLWFVKEAPRVGDKAVASSFSTEDGWRTTTVSFVQDKPFMLGEKSVTGHLIKHENPKNSHNELVDDNGLPLEFDVAEVPGLHFSRNQYQKV
jgi:hypothetical protein